LKIWCGRCGRVWEGPLRSAMEIAEGFDVLFGAGKWDYRGRRDE
jgi:hypothetical protein